MVDNHERLARSELAGRPTLYQRHGRANLPSTPLGDRRSPKRPNPQDGVPRLEGSAVRQSNLGKPQPRQSTRPRRRRVARDMRWRALRPLLPSWPQHKPHSYMFVAIGREVSNATTRTATSLRIQTEQQRNEQGKRPISHNFTLQTSLGFALMCMYKCFAIE